MNSVDSNTDIMRVSDITIVTGEEKTIMDYLGVGAFSALTAPYALSAGGGGIPPSPRYLEWGLVA